MNSLWALALICTSPTTIVGNITIANRVPAACTEILGAPPLPVSKIDLAAMPYNVTEKPVEPPRAKKATKPAKKAKKPARRKPCKPGRTRNSRGICGRW